MSKSADVFKRLIESTVRRVIREENMYLKQELRQEILSELKQLDGRVPVRSVPMMAEHRAAPQRTAPVQQPVYTPSQPIEPLPDNMLSEMIAESRMAMISDGQDFRNFLPGPEGYIE